MKMKPYLHGQVIAWEALTPRQQAEHLVHGHGFDEDYFHDPSRPEPHNDELVEELARWDDAQRARWHEEDHKELQPEDSILRFIHDHEKVRP